MVFARAIVHGLRSLQTFTTLQKVMEVDQLAVSILKKYEDKVWLLLLSSGLFLKPCCTETLYSSLPRMPLSILPTSRTPRISKEPMIMRLY